MENTIIVPIEKFSIENRKDEINPYMIGKILRKKYEAIGYKVFQAQDFESNLLVEFVRRYKILDKYTKVKLGEYRKNQKTLDYNKELIKIMGWERIEKLLFLCRICSYLGDPSFPDFIIYGKGEPELRYAYSGDELVKSRLFFILIAEKLGLKIKFCSIDFSDFKQKEAVETDFSDLANDVISSLSSRVDFETSLKDIGIDFRIFRDWEAEIDSKDALHIYETFKKNLSQENKIKDLLTKLEVSGRSNEIEGKQKPEQLLALRNLLGVNMMEAHELINLYNICKS